MNPIEANGKRLSRREFVKGSAAGGAAGLMAGAGGTGFLMANRRKQWLPPKWDYETDVVVVGTGFAGCNAAIASRDAGASVLVLEKAPEKYAGGNSGVSGGGMRIPTNVSDAVEYYRALCFGTVPDDLCNDLAAAMAQVPEQLRKLGIPVEPVRMFAGLPKGMAIKDTASASSRQKRALNLLPGAASSSIYAIVPEGETAARMRTGYQLYLAHKRCMQERKIPVMYETPVKELIQDPETKAILGVAAEQEKQTIYVKGKRAVVMACGGYEANFEMQGYYNYPGIKIYPWGTPYNTGDGIQMASAVGAPLWHMCSIEWDGPCIKAPSEHHGVSVHAGILTVAGIPGNYILVNKYGRRFMNDVKSLTHSKESLELTYFDYEQVEYPNIPFYLVFDETQRQRRPLVPRQDMSWNGIHNLVEWSEDNSAEIEKGWILKGNSIAELAANMGIDPQALQRTVSTYNRYCRDGKDTEFGRLKETLFPVTTPPFYSAELALTCTNTQGGPKHNGKAQTLDKGNEPIPRLYTPGELGSFFGFLYPGGSNIPEAIAFGRIAGENAAAEKPWT